MESIADRAAECNPLGDVVAQRDLAVLGIPHIGVMLVATGQIELKPLAR